MREVDVAIIGAGTAGMRDAAAAALGADLPFDPDAGVQGITRDGDAVVVRFREGEATREERFDWLLAATGRAPALEGLNLAASPASMSEWVTRSPSVPR